MSYNGTLEVEAESSKLREQLTADKVKPPLPEVDGEEVALLLDKGIDAVLSITDTYDRFDGGEVLASVGLHLGDADEHGFETGHVTMSISKVHPHAKKQREEQETAAQEVRERHEAEQAKKEGTPKPAADLPGGPIPADRKVEG